MLRITLPVADLRSDPQNIPKQDFSLQPMRESQLLYNEHLELIGQQGEWLQVQALEQIRFDPNHNWHPYPGWVHRSEVEIIDQRVENEYVVCEPNNLFSYGTYLNKGDAFTRKLPKQPLRAQIVADALHFLDTPYLWGGRASMPFASADCSGLINLLYRAQGVQIPRDAYDQFLFSHPVSSLQPGDPLFLAKEKRVHHVILKINEKTYIEAPETGKNIRLLTWGKEVWKEADKIHFYDRPHAYTAYPRSFLT